MSWSSTFIDFIEDERQFKPVVKIVKHVMSEWGQPPAFTASTHPFFIESDRVINDGSIQMSGYRLNQQNGVVSGGGFQFSVDSNPGLLLTRGSILKFFLGFDGLDESDMEILDWGVVRSITSHGGIKLPNGVPSQGPWTITCDPFFAALLQRPSTDPAHITLFYESTVGLASGTTSGEQEPVMSAYTAGDSTLQVGSVVDFNTNGSIGAVLVQDSTSGASFYGTWSGTSGGDTFDPFAGGWLQHGSDANVSTSGTVYEVPFLQGHPSEIFLAILTSTGVGLNGAWDIYNVSWGLGMDVAHVNVADAATYFAASNTADDLVLTWIPNVPITNALQTLISILAPGGWYPVVVQGGFSLRCTIAPESSAPDDGLTIIDRDIDESPDGITFSMFSDSAPVVYSQVIARGYDMDPAEDPFVFSTMNDEVATLPAQYLWEINYNDINTGLLFDPDVTIVHDQWLQSILDRCSPWLQNIAQSYTLKCVGYRLFQTAVGSRVLLSTGQDSSGAYARLVEKDGTYPRGRRAVVVGWFPDPMRGKITLELEVMPVVDEVG